MRENYHLDYAIEAWWTGLQRNQQKWMQIYDSTCQTLITRAKGLLPPGNLYTLQTRNPGLAFSILHLDAPPCDHRLCYCDPRRLFDFPPACYQLESQGENLKSRRTGFSATPNG